MSLTYAFVLMALTGLAGIAVGYIFRWLLSLSRKGSVELEVKQIILDAREDAKKITAEAEAQAICMQTQDFRRAYEAFVNKQQPVFEGN